MTPLGLMFAAVFCACLTRGLSGLVFFVALAAPFYDSSMVSSGDFGVSPYYVGLIAYIALAAFAPRRPAPPPRGTWMIVALGMITLVGTVTLPLVFEGVGVVAPDIGLDGQYMNLTPLRYSQSNTAQLIYLGLNLAFVLLVARDREKLIGSISVGLGFGVLICVAGYLSGPAFPHELFDNTPGASYASLAYTPRYRGVFAEPSHLGGFALTALAFFAMASFQWCGKRRVLSIAMAAGAGALFALSLSATAVAGLLVGAVVVACIAFACGPRDLLSVRIPPGVALTALVALGIGALWSSRLASAVAEMAGAKQGSVSLRSRTFADMTGLHLTFDTYGLGVGLGSQRTSSMLVFVIANLGVVGALLFLALLARSIRNAIGDPDARPHWVALTFLACASFVSLPNFASPLLWLLIAACWHAAPHGLDRVPVGPVGDVVDRGARRDRRLLHGPRHGIDGE